MLNKKLSPVIGNFAGACSSGNWAGLSDPASSPKSPLQFATQSPSPRGLKNYHLDKVGLGIVVEMEKSGEIISTTKAAFGQNIDRPNLVRVHKEIEDDLEEHTFVTRHETNKSYTRVYFDDSKRGLVEGKNYRVATFYLASPKFEDSRQYPVYDFLNSCQLCKKSLHGKDIYMYRGEKGFCSNECRYEHIMRDKRDEK